MAQRTWTPVGKSGLKQRTDDVVRHFSEDGILTRGRPTRVRELPEQLTFRCSMHGIDANDVEIEIDGDQMVISGEYGNGHTKAGRDFLHRERRDGYFVRTVYLPEGSNPCRGQALINNNVLEINLDVDQSQQSGQPLFLKPEVQG